MKGGVKRLGKVVSTISKHGMGYFAEHIGLKEKDLNGISERPTPERIRKILEDLGGSFVKLGQLLSLRPDLIPVPYCKEFSKLQDEVKPVPQGQVDKVIQRALGKNLQSYVLQPIASASIGQVHKGVWKDGSEVAIKVKRPGIDDLMKEDIEILTKIANLVEKMFRPKIFSPKEIVEEFKDYTVKELDYTLEAENLKEMHENFVGTNVIIPKVKFSSPDVLVMEYVEGKELRKYIEEEEPDEELAKKITQAVFKQVFEDGFFHADPHPGNIFVSHGTIAFLDLGIVGKVKGRLKDGLSDLFIGVIQKDSGKMVDAFTKMNMVGDVNKEELRKELRKAFSVYYDIPLDDIKLSELIHKAIGIAKRNGMRMNKNLVLLGKSVVTLEGTVAELNPEFDLMKVAKPYVAKLIAAKPKRTLKSLLSKSGSLAEFIMSWQERDREEKNLLRHADEELERLDYDLRKFERDMSQSAYRLITGMVATALIVSAALTAGIPQSTMFGFPRISFMALVTAGILLLVIFISWLES